MNDLFFGDKLRFHLSGYVNIQNNMMWLSEQTKSSQISFKKLAYGALSLSLSLSSTRSGTPFLRGCSWQGHIPQRGSPLHYITGKGWTPLLALAREPCAIILQITQCPSESSSGDLLISKDLCLPRSPDLTHPEFLSWRLLKRRRYGS
jgi:hypothetical protein